MILGKDLWVVDSPHCLQEEGYKNHDPGTEHGSLEPSREGLKSDREVLIS